MKKINKTICGKCKAVLDVSALEPFTKFSCPGCGNELYSPASLVHLRFDTPLRKIACFNEFEGFDAKGNLYVNIFCSDGKKCPECGIENIFRASSKEAEILKKLSHPNICPVSGSWIIEENFVITSPSMDGFDLAQYKPEDGLLDFYIVLDLLQKIAIGLAFAHHKEILHHDICPANVHIDARGNVRIKNFFISRFLYKCCSRNDWKSDFSNFEYHSPEKILTRQEGKEGDVFSFAVLSYFLLSGTMPFSGKTREEIAFARCENSKDNKNSYKKPIPLSELRKDFPQQISEILLKMLLPNPLSRGSLADFISAVNLYKADTEKDRIYETKWKMVAGNTDTRPIPRLDKIGLSGADINKKADSIAFSIKSLFAQKKE